MLGRRVLPILFLLSAVSAPRYRTLALERTVTGAIHRGETLQCRIPSTSSTVRVDVVQTDIDLAIDGPATHVDSAEFGTEHAYFIPTQTGEIAFRIAAESNGTRVGAYAVTARSPTGSVPKAITAQRLEADGLADMEPRRAETQQSAVAELSSAAEEWTAAGDTLREGNCRHWLGRALERISRHRDADTQYLQAIRLLHEAGADAAELNARKIWMNLGGHVGESRASIADLEKMLAAWRVAGDRRGVALLTGSLASAFTRQHNNATARSFAQESARLWNELGDIGAEASAVQRLAGLDLVDHAYSDAVVHASRALELARQLKDQGTEISALGTLGSALEFVDRPSESAVIYIQLRELQRKRGDKTAWESATTSLAFSFHRIGRSADAEQLLREINDSIGIRLQESVKPAAYFSASGYGMFAPVVNRMAFDRKLDPALAFWLSDAQRSRFIAGDGNDRVQRLQALLGSDTVLLAFHLELQDGGVGVVWALDGDAVTFHPLTNFVEAGRRALDAATQLRLGREPNQAALALTTEVFLGPIRHKIAGKRLVVVSDELLHAFPIALLPDGDALLGDRHEIVYAPGGQALAAIMDRERRSRKPGIAVFSDPVTSALDVRHLRKPRAAGLEFPQLHNAQDEADRIRSAARNREFAKFEGFNATLEKFREQAKRAEIVHMLAHAAVNLDRPGESGIAFSSYTPDGAARDGFLRFDEIADSKIDAELVTLAACDTSVGQILGKQGVPTLSQAFLRAGARRTVSSFWKVDDAATRQLMIEFYTQLFSSAKPTPAKALWNAQMSVRRQPKWSNPYYWAGFALHGDWRAW